MEKNVKKTNTVWKIQTMRDGVEMWCGWCSVHETMANPAGERVVLTPGVPFACDRCGQVIQ